jgi:hypothetical protein
MGSDLLWLHIGMIGLGMIILPVALYWISLFSQTALMTGVQACFRGEDVSVGRAIQQAWARRWLILQWAVVSGLVQAGLDVVRMGTEHLGKIPWIGRIMASFLVLLIGLAWNLASYLVLPVLVYEWVTPREGLKRSVHLVKQLAGETVTGWVGFSAGWMLLAGVPFLLGIGFLIASALVSIFMGSTNDIQKYIAIPGFALILVSVISWPFLALLNFVLDGVFRVGLYMYAVEGVVPEPYTTELLDRVWVVKPKKVTV